jgi:hypothetical protein
VTDAFLATTSAAAGVDHEAARGQRDGSVAASVLRDAQAEADRLGVQGTPASFVRRADGKVRPLEVNELTPDAFSAALDEALAAR